MTHPRYDEMLALLDAERDEERARLDELLRTLSPEERAERGITLLDLACVDERYGLGGRIVLDLARDDRGPLAARIDEGDLVAAHLALEVRVLELDDVAGRECLD